ncbi:MAG: DUF1800 family protein [Pseudomonadota bacterium]
MRKRTITNLAQSAALALVLSVAACGGGGSDSGGTLPGGSGSAPPSPPPPPPPPPPPVSGAFETNETTALFLSQATFGPTQANLSNLTGTSPSDWFVAELNKPASFNLDYVLNEISQPDARDTDGQLTYEKRNTPTFSFWINAIEGDDQLRQRMAFALSQILVISHAEGNFLFEAPNAVAHYQDILVSNAFGNYRDLLEEVTYSPAMGEYLTYLQNIKGDAATGRMPDENYAREVMQLFSTGLVELEQDGDVVTQNGVPIELYTNADVTGLARVFTGLSLKGGEFWFDYRDLPEDALHSSMQAYPEWHSELQKSFLGTTIAAGTGPEESIDLALDTLVNHPNTAPFVSRQLIQRFVTSHPEPDYIGRVSAAFAAGQYTLPNGSVVGDGRRGDLSATIAAILFDDDAREATSRDQDTFGKIREPVLRFIQWARAFDANTVTPELTFQLYNTSFAGSLSQAPYKSPSVFNFYRPGYIAPGTETGAAGLTMPELQLVNANSISNYANFMTFFIFGFAANDTDNPGAASFIPDYSDELALATDPTALVDHLDLLLTYGTTSAETKATIVNFLEEVALEVPSDPNYDGPFLRVAMGILMVMTSPDYIVQR